MHTTLALGTLMEKRALREIADGAKVLPSIRRVVVFGSRVRGDFGGDSDLDVLVLLASISTKSEVVRFLYGIETELDVPITPVIYTVAEYERNRALRSAFIEKVESEGVVIYDAERA